MTDTPVQAVTGRIFDIQRFSIHDGPGIRTTVFLKGCTLRCQWCHNPESIDPQPVLSFMPDKCIGCGYCFRVCPEGAHRMENGKHVLDREKCTVCGLCAKECYAKALEIVGRDATVTEVIDEVLRDRPFYETSGGGMTLSGGEPLLQIEFTTALLQAAKLAGLHCAVETCGAIDFARFERVLPYVDLFLYDLKDMDPERHKQFTGAPNDAIIANVRQLHDHGAAVILRLPIVPGLNDRPDHFEGVAKLASELPQLRGVEIIPYHTLGTSKLERLGIEDVYQLRDIKTPEPETVAEWCNALRALGVNVLNRDGQDG